MPSTNHFDYVIIGNGLAGLQLALQLSSDSFFDNKQVLLIDKSDKNSNDKTWCFWEKHTGKWDHIVYRTWDKAMFHTSKTALKLSLSPYKYKMIRSIDFYKDAKSILSKKANFHFVLGDVIDINENDLVTIQTKDNFYTANHVFDSRINNTFFNKKDNYIRINQHFKGWTIETDSDVFDPDRFTMMDYRIKDGNQTAFTYILPFSTKKALVEFTYFTPQIVDDSTYDVYLKKYILDILKIEDYTITQLETGNIPMTNFPFQTHSTKHITKIGTAGGWVKGSTGYSFKHTEKKVLKIIENLKLNKLPSKGLYNKRYAFYDKVFLRVLQDENDKGEWIFEKFYTKNSVETMFEFLDEESSFYNDLKIMNALFSFSFIKAFFKTLLF
ncbi:lycopene cyclase family protein [Yeosuana marina]|uniref:lycopene cyclase family protein n=1 Tax=Yeosuana marina TaxID=1565536 RepID=UPI0030C8A103